MHWYTQQAHSIEENTRIIVEGMTNFSLVTIKYEIHLRLLTGDTEIGEKSELYRELAQWSLKLYLEFVKHKLIRTSPSISDTKASGEAATFILR
jgi:hypothetical protein